MMRRHRRLAVAEVAQETAESNPQFPRLASPSPAGELSEVVAPLPPPPETIASPVASPSAQPDAAPAASLAYRPVADGQVGMADGKAAGLLTFLGLMFALLARYAPAVDALMARGGAARWACYALLMGFAFSGLAAVVQAFRTISPRFPKSAPSLAFFGDVAKLTREQYVRRMEEMSAEEAMAHMLGYNHTASLICAEKQRHLGRGLRCFEAAAACWLPLVLAALVQALCA